MQKNLLRIQVLKKTEGYSEVIKFYCGEIDRMGSYDGWLLDECNLKKIFLAKEELVRRAVYCRKIINNLP